ncbi:MAG: Bax inhibitor-1/YccA family protein, partial [Candidatus Limnocylindrales bacterium]
MFDRNRNQPDNFQNPAGGWQTGAPVGSQLPGSVIINGQRVDTKAVPREGVLTMSFVWMFVALLVSAFSVWFVYSNLSALSFVSRNYLPLIIGEVALVLVISFAINRIHALVALGLLFVYAMLTGLTVGAIVVAYISAGSLSGVISAFAGASAVFAAAGAYGFVTKRDLTGIGGILFMGLIGLIVMSFVQLFLFPGNNTFSLIIGAVGVLIFTGLTAYDVQRLKNGQLAGVKSRESASVIGALALYL